MSNHQFYLSIDDVNSPLTKEATEVTKFFAKERNKQGQHSKKLDFPKSPKYGSKTDPLLRRLMRDSYIAFYQLQ